MDNVIIFDTTLRDGEQAAGAMLNMQEKLEIAKQLERLGVDVIEAGFPATSPGDFEAVKLIAKEVRYSSICALTHANAKAIDTAWDAVKEAMRPRIHVFLSTSDIHMAHQLKKNRDEVMALARDMVARARSYTEDIEFSPMDASRTDPEFLHAIVQATIEAGATHGEHPGHGGLRHSGGVRQAHPRHLREGAQRQQGRDQRPLPQ